MTAGWTRKMKMREEAMKREQNARTGIREQTLQNKAIKTMPIIG